MTYFMGGKLRELRNVGFFGVIAVIIIILISSFLLFPSVEISNLGNFNFSNFFLPFGVVFFSLLGLNSIPELRREVGKDRKMLKKAILLGASIPILLYIIFSFIFVGVLGGNVQDVATLSFNGIFGKFLLLLGIFSMMTCFFILSFALRDCFILDLRKRKISFFYVSIVPLVLYLLVSFFDLAGFVEILGIGGSISGGLMVILILIMNKVSKNKGELKPEYSVKINWFIISILSFISLAGIFFELF